LGISAGSNGQGSYRGKKLKSCQEKAELSSLKWSVLKVINVQRPKAEYREEGSLGSESWGWMRRQTSFRKTGGGGLQLGG